MTQAELAQSLEAVTNELRDTYRIKRNTDFAYTFKYGLVHVLCARVFMDSVREAFAKHSVPIASMNTYE